jgi:pseudouridine synthase
MVLRLTSLLFASKPPASCLEATGIVKPMFDYYRSFMTSPLFLASSSTGITTLDTSRSTTSTNSWHQSRPPRSCLQLYPFPSVAQQHQTRGISGTLARRRKLKRLSKKTNNSSSSALSRHQKNVRINQIFAKFGLTTVQDVTRTYQQSLEDDSVADTQDRRRTNVQMSSSSSAEKQKKKKKPIEVGFEENESTNNKAYTFKYRGKKSLTQKLVRVDRVLANRGVGSRGDTSSLCKAKRVAVLMQKQQFQPEYLHTTPFTSLTLPSLLVSNKHEEENVYQIINGPSDRIPVDATLLIDQTHVIPPLPLLLLYHKPKGVLSTMKDEPIIFQGKKRWSNDDESITNSSNDEAASTNFDDVSDQDEVLNQEEGGRRPHLGDVLPSQYLNAGMHPVGRLDYDTSGLLLFSSDGGLTQRLLHPKHGIAKEYVATVQGAIHSEEEKLKIQRQFQVGVKTTEGIHTAEIVSISTETNTIRSTSRIRLIVSEGKHRMVRRMLANIGYPVLELRRERHGLCMLNDLPEGHFRYLSPEEMDWAENLLKSQ